MNCQMFSWLLSSGERGGNSAREVLVGILSYFWHGHPGQAWW
jgi:hypothetical protein